MEINQGTRFSDYRIITKNDSIKIKLNTSELKKELDTIFKGISDSIKKAGFTGECLILGACTLYFNNIKDKFDKATNESDIVSISWSDKNNWLSSNIEFKNIKNINGFSLNTMNYIMLGQGELLVDIDVTEMADAIAFELMRRDMGFSDRDMEDILADCSIIHENSYSKLYNIYKNDKVKPYELSKELKFGESPYYSLEDSYLKDYFLISNYKNPENYNDCVSNSCKIAVSKVALNIVESVYKAENSNKRGEMDSIDREFYMNLIQLSDTSLTFITNMDMMDVKKHIQPINIRCLGRRFQINPKIAIY